MANAKINTITIETPVQEVVTVIKKEEKQTGVSLELSMAEAETLRVILQHVGGDPKNSPRKYADRLRRALSAAGVVLDKGHYVVSNWEGIMFADYPKATKKAPEEKPVEAAPAPQEPRKFQKGDKVRVVSVEAGYLYFSKGDVGIVVGHAPSGNPQVNFNQPENANVYGDGLWWAGEINGNSTLELVTEDTKRVPKVGDTIRFLDNYASVFKAGQTGKVEKVLDNGETLYGTGIEQANTFWIDTHKGRYELVNVDHIETARAA